MHTDELLKLMVRTIVQQQHESCIFSLAILLETTTDCAIQQQFYLRTHREARSAHCSTFLEVHCTCWKVSSKGHGRSTGVTHTVDRGARAKRLLCGCWLTVDAWNYWRPGFGKRELVTELRAASEFVCQWHVWSERLCSVRGTVYIIVCTVSDWAFM